MKKVCIFCGSNTSSRHAYLEAAQRTGVALAKQGIGLVYGGGRVGLMGAVADAAPAEGGDVIGVIPEALVTQEVAHQGLRPSQIRRAGSSREARRGDREMEESENLRRATELWRAAYRYQMEGELDRAIEHYQRSVEVYPTAEAHTFLGWTLSFQGRSEEATAECLRAIEIAPEFGNPYNDIGVPDAAGPAGGGHPLAGAGQAGQEV